MWVAYKALVNLSFLEFALLDNLSEVGKITRTVSEVSVRPKE